MLEDYLNLLMSLVWENLTSYKLSLKIIRCFGFCTSQHSVVSLTSIESIFVKDQGVHIFTKTTLFDSLNQLPPSKNYYCFLLSFTEDNLFLFCFDF